MTSLPFYVNFRGLHAQYPNNNLIGLINRKACRTPDNFYKFGWNSGNAFPIFIPRSINYTRRDIPGAKNHFNCRMLKYFNIMYRSERGGAIDAGTIRRKQIACTFVFGTELNNRLTDSDRFV